MNYALLGIAVFAATTLQANPVQFVFRTDPSSIASDLDGNGSEETYASLTTPTFIRFTMGDWQSEGLSAPSDSRYFYFAGQLGLDGMYLAPISHSVQGSGVIRDVVGFTFDEQVYIAGSGTHHYGGYRVDESFYLQWNSQYSNLVAVNLAQVNGVGGNLYWSATLDLFQTLTNLKNAEKQFYFNFSNVWSNPNTYTYLRHSNWAGYGQIVSVSALGDTAATPEPATAALAVGALGLAVIFRRVLARKTTRHL